MPLRHDESAELRCLRHALSRFHAFRHAYGVLSDADILLFICCRCYL